MIVSLSIAALAAAPAVQGTSRPAVIVRVENAAPANGTFQTPVWVGLHDGTFDTYDSGALASSLPQPASDAIERIAEDGNTGPLTAEFDTLALDSPQGTILSNGMAPVFDPGRVTSRLFEVDPTQDRYFSYASMVIPSNDGFISNGNPMAHPLFDAMGDFIGQPFTVFGDEVLDAGTEENDEIPMNTAFFGQMAPNVGVATSDLIGPHPGFLSPSIGGILADPMFSGADFTMPGYETLKFSFIPVDRSGIYRFDGVMSTAQEVQDAPVLSRGRGLVTVGFDGGSDALRVVGFAIGMTGNITAAHLHLGPEGTNGQVSVNLTSDVFQLLPGVAVFDTTMTGTDLVGPLAGEADPLGAMLAELMTEGVYLNLHTALHPMGELRAQLR